MNTQKGASPNHSIHELIARRWSPYAFSDRPVSDEDLRSLFEAARWAASSYNEQPWRYIVATKARELYGIPEDVQPLTGLAIGYAADPTTLPEKLRERDLAPRTRKPLAKFVFGGQWGTASSLIT
jgi:nitroreductase